MIKKRGCQVAAGSLIIALAIGAFGCSSDDNNASRHTPDPTVPTSPSQVAGQSIAPSESPGTQYGQERLTAVANTNIQNSGSDENTDSTSTDDHPEITFEAYSVDTPLLMGIAIGESYDTTTTLHGSPLSSYTMEDEDGPLTVYEYASFHVGFNNSNLVEFVEITDADADPGLHGLRLGLTTAEASQFLGMPDFSSNYVLTYKTKETILKIDLDSKTRTIQSIKLFARSDV